MAKSSPSRQRVERSPTKFFLTVVYKNLLRRAVRSLLTVVGIAIGVAAVVGLAGNIDLAVDRALQMIAEGADLLDIGGESTRPGAMPVDEIEEINRVVPII